MPVTDMKESLIKMTDENYNESTEWRSSIKVSYSVEDTPPFMVSLFLGFQVCSNSTVFNLKMCFK